jgi:hypothetical protein
MESRDTLQRTESRKGVKLSVPETSKTNAGIGMQDTSETTPDLSTTLLRSSGRDDKGWSGCGPRRMLGKSTRRSVAMQVYKTLRCFTNLNGERVTPMLK